MGEFVLVSFLEEDGTLFGSSENPSESPGMQLGKRPQLVGSIMQLMPELEAEPPGQRRTKPEQWR